MQNRLTFTEAVNLALIENYANFTGRSSRSEFWWFALFLFALGIVEAMIINMLGVPEGPTIAWVVNLTMTLPLVSLMVRRLHDINRSGWWAALGLVPIVGLVLVYWLTLPSQSSDNAYGLEPNCDFD
ncbi:MAG: DUF805 domain-containing protein [Pseudoflavonifractor sp.]|nr:DUF805 domain-containing protein [Alloprevotella sp.]MCM1116991.1 DUF805 domain-containing protein [Pseudoflavonifractor sp.]